MVQQLTDQTMDTLLSGDLFDILGLAGISSKKRQEMTTDMIVAIQNRIIARLQDALPENEQDTLIEALTAKDRERTLGILSTGNLPSLETMAVEEALIYKRQLIDEVIAS